MHERGVLPRDMSANPRPDVGVDGEVAFALWHRLGGEVRLPEVFYWFEFYGITDAELMLERLLAIRDAVRSYKGSKARV
jgi:hypothetical protein